MLQRLDIPIDGAQLPQCPSHDQPLHQEHEHQPTDGQHREQSLEDLQLIKQRNQILGNGNRHACIADPITSAAHEQALSARAANFPVGHLPDWQRLDAKQRVAKQLVAEQLAAK